MATDIAVPEDIEGVHGLTIPKYKKYSNKNKATKYSDSEEEKLDTKQIKDSKLKQFIEKYKLHQLSDVLVREGITIEFLVSQSESQIDEIAAELTPFKIQQNKFKFAVKSIKKDRKHKKKKKKLESKGNKHPHELFEAANMICKMNQNLKVAIDCKREEIKAKFGSNKTVTTWWYNGSDGAKHEISLTHYNKLDKQKRSKRKLVVDRQERYSKKSNDVNFIIEHCADKLKVRITYDKQQVAHCELYINEEAFSALLVERVASFSL